MSLTDSAAVKSAQTHPSTPIRHLVVKTLAAGSAASTMLDDLAPGETLGSGDIWFTGAYYAVRDDTTSIGRDHLLMPSDHGVIDKVTYSGS